MSLLGGDTTRTDGPLAIAITALGSIPRGAAVRREGARAGDVVFVTGTVGDAGLGLDLLRKKKRSPRVAIEKYRVPQPRLAFGRRLREFATASIDVSDGLLADLGHISDISRVAISIDAARVPLSNAVRAHWGATDRSVLRATSAGDDFEIAFTCRPRDVDRVQAAALKTKTKVTLIGQVERGRGISLVGKSGKKLPFSRGGFTHF